MERLNPWVVGAALALTAVVLYAVCAAAFALWPETTLAFFNAWFHGLNLGTLQSGARPFTFGAFLYGLLGLTASAFVCGALFAGFANWLRMLAPGRLE